MLPEQDLPNLRVCCECGKWIAVMASQAGGATSCTCGRRVEVPLLEEFENGTDVLSATTVESRISLLIGEGVLPHVGQCARCGAQTADVAPLKLDCERYTAHNSGGLRFLFFPLVSLLVFVWWREEERLEIRGRDTIVRSPLCLCKSCQSWARGRAGVFYLGIAVLFVSLGFLVGYFDWIIGLALAGCGLLGIIMWRWLSFRARQRALKSALQGIPVYRQIMTSFPYAVVVVPPE